MCARYTPGAALIIKPHLPSHGTHQRVCPVRRLFDIDDGIQVQLELGYVLASFQSDVKERVAITAVEWLVKAVLGAHDDQLTILLKQIVHKEGQLHVGREAAGRRRCAMG